MILETLQSLLITSVTMSVTSLVWEPIFLVPFAESTCAALVIGSQGDLWTHWSYCAFPLTISAFGLCACFITSFFATHFFQVNEEDQIEPRLKQQLLISTVLMTP